MTDATAGRGGVGIRLYTTGGEVVKRTFDQVGDSGKKMWAEIALGERSANPAVRALSRGVGEARDGIDALGARAGTAGTMLGAFGFAGAAAAAALGGLAIATTTAFEAMGRAADLTDAADRIGVGVEALQQWRYAADEAGVPVAALEAGMEKLNGVVGAFKAGIGDGKLKPVFESLGITKAQLSAVDDAEGLLKLLADTLGQVEDRATQVKLARALGVEELLPLLRQGSDGIEEMLDASVRLGVVLDRETVQKLDEADRKAELAGQQLKTLAYSAVEPLATFLANAGAWTANLANEFDNIQGKAPGWIKMLMDLGRALPGSGGIQRLGEMVLGGAFGGRIRDASPKFDDDHTVVGPGSLSDMRALARGGGGFALEDRKDKPGGGRGGASNNAARQAEREAEQRRQREERAGDQLRRLESDIARSGDKMLLSIDDRAFIAVRDLELERADRLREIARAEEEYVRSNGLRGLTQAEAEQLRLKAQELFTQKEGIVEWERRRDLAAERLRQDEMAAEAGIELLEIDSQLATTNGERVRIEREILLATIQIARKRKQAELEADNELTPEQRSGFLRDFDRASNRRVTLFDQGEDRRLRDQFKSYGREVVQAIEDGRIGEYIGDQLKQRLLDGALDALFDGMKGAGGGSGWTSKVISFASSLFGGGRAGGGGVRAGFRYDLAEHGRPELLMLGGQGQVTDAAATARMLRDSMGMTGGAGSMVVQQTLHFDNRGAVMTADLLAEMDRKADTARRQAVADATQLSRRSAPGMQQRLGRLGTP